MASFNSRVRLFSQSSIFYFFSRGLSRTASKNNKKKYQNTLKETTAHTNFASHHLDTDRWEKASSASPFGGQNGSAKHPHCRRKEQQEKGNGQKHTNTFEPDRLNTPLNKQIQGDNLFFQDLVFVFVFSFRIKECKTQVVCVLGCKQSCCDLSKWIERKMNENSAKIYI